MAKKQRKNNGYADTWCDFIVDSAINVLILWILKIIVYG